jgi:uncharacterized protein YukE
MAGLSIQGDPDSWLDAGYSVKALAARLESELSDADTFGPQALARSWYGPAASAFSASWATRRARYDDLVDLTRRAGQAITSYGEALQEVQEHARVLEYTWCAAGLVLADGFFVLPAGLELLPSAVRMSLEKTLSDALRDVESLEADVAAGVVSLALGLSPVIALLAEFALAGIGSISISEIEHEFMKIAENPITVGLIGMIPALTQKLAGVLPDTELVDGIAKDGDPVLDVLDALDATWDVAHDATREGLLASLEQNAGGLTQTAVAMGIGGAVTGVLAAGGVLLIAAGAPELVVGVGVVVGATVVTGLIAAGVGHEVQTVVNKHKQAINQGVELMGQGVEVIAHYGEDTAAKVGSDAMDEVDKVF